MGHWSAPVWPVSIGAVREGAVARGVMVVTAGGPADVV